MLNSKYTVGGAIISVVTLVICAVILIALLAVYELSAKLSGAPAIVFACVNLIILFLLVALGRNLFGGMLFAAKVQIWFITILYTAVQFGVLFALADVWGALGYSLFQVVVVMLWLGIVGAVITIGNRNNKREDGIS